MSKYYHGTFAKINRFSHDYAGTTTGNNEAECIYFTSDYNVAREYSEEAIFRNYEYRFEKLREKYGESAVNSRIYGYARDNIKVYEVDIDFENPYIYNYEGKIIDAEKTFHQLCALQTVYYNNCIKNNINGNGYWEYGCSDDYYDILDEFEKYDDELDEYVESGKKAYDCLILQDVVDCCLYEQSVMEECIVWDLSIIKNKRLMAKDEVNVWL